MTNEMIKTHHKEPLIHIVKRDDMVWWKAWLIRIVTIIVAVFAVGGISMLLTGNDFSQTYETFYRGVLGRLDEGNTTMLWQYLQDVAILLCLALALTPAFKMRFWNCGAEGQALMGGLAAMICMRELGELPYWAQILIIVVTSILAGALWGFIPAIFKAFFNTNETLFTLMMNYIAIQLVAYYVVVGSNGNTVLPTSSSGNLPIIAENEYLLNVLVVAVLSVIAFFYLKYSKHGYEISVVGESQNTARYIGINVKKVIIRTMLISGAVCGIAGMLLVAGTDHSINTNTIEGQGFTAIMISWLGQFNPFIMMLMTAVVIFVGNGFGKVTERSNLDKSFADIATGIVILCVVGCEFFIHYSIKFRSSKKEAKK